MTLALTRAGPDDIPALCELLSWLFEQEEEMSADPERQRRGLEAILQEPARGRIWVAREAEAVVGMVSLLFVPSTALGGEAALLEDFVVRPDRRGEGLGAALLGRALGDARAAGCLRVTLLTDADNAAAKRLYRRFGFVDSPMRPLRLVFGASVSPRPRGAS
jgi:GNAT superfamily N-acetyltransferase